MVDSMKVLLVWGWLLIHIALKSEWKLKIYLLARYASKFAKGRDKLVSKSFMLTLVACFLTIYNRNVHVHTLFVYS